MPNSSARVSKLVSCTIEYDKVFVSAAFLVFANGVINYSTSMPLHDRELCLSLRQEMKCCQN